jgi:predicted lipase
VSSERADVESWIADVRQYGWSTKQEFFDTAIKYYAGYVFSPFSKEYKAVCSIIDEVVELKSADYKE